MMSTKLGSPTVKDHPLDLTFGNASKQSHPSVDQPALDLSVPKRGVKPKDEGPPLRSGWLQINNTVVPYVRPAGSEQRWLPASVLRYAANLDLQLTADVARKSSEHESATLNRRCKTAGVSFTFVKHTKLVTLEVLEAVMGAGALVVKDLPPDDPFGGATYHDDSGASRVLQNYSFQPVPHEMPSATAFPHTSVGPGIPQVLQANQPSKTLPSVCSTTSACKQAQQRSTVSTANNPSLNRAPLLTASRSKCHRNSSETGHIRPLLVNGRPISCLVDGPHSFALLEAVSRIFYPESGLRSVQYAIEKVLQIPTRKITAQQEKAFIAFYKLPTKRLHCRIMVDVLLIAENLNNIKTVLEESDRMRNTKKQHKHQLKNNDTQEETRGLGAEKKAGTAHPVASEAAAADAPGDDGHAGNGATDAELTARKRLPQIPPSKTNPLGTSGKKKRLEDMVSRLKSACR